MSLVSELDVWSSRFFKSGELLRRLLEDLTINYKDTSIPDLVKFVTDAERTQSYVWTYIDYCFRTPIFRTFQWLDFSLKLNRDLWNLIAKDKGKEGEWFLNSLTIHLLKEYVLVWSRIMVSLDETMSSSGVKKQGELPKPIRDVLGSDLVNGAALADLKGIASELKAFYVLVDKRKPFLPFSIMQSPIIPSYVRPGTSSGDLYLFEENLVVDVKSGRLDGKTGLPTYYYGKNANLSKDLKRISDMHRLYGIRKGIGVVAEDEEYIHLAIYVPWRRWRREEPLLCLKSPKLPLLVYMNNIKGTGVSHHRVNIERGKVKLTVNAYDLREKPHAEELNITLSFLNNQEVKIEGRIARDNENPRKVALEFTMDSSNMKNSAVTDSKSGKQVILAKLLVQYEKRGVELDYPLLSVTD